MLFGGSIGDPQSVVEEEAVALSGPAKNLTSPRKKGLTSPPGRFRVPDSTVRHEAFPPEM